eukprot:COSAG05_NODE_1614_length_4406_cov_2.286510_4_plen_148_part_00
MRLHRAMEALAIFNQQSEEHSKVLGPRFQAKGKQLVLIKTGLDGIFKRIGKLKATMQERPQRVPSSRKCQEKLSADSAKKGGGGRPLQAVVPVCEGIKTSKIGGTFQSATALCVGALNQNSLHLSALPESRLPGRCRLSLACTLWCV